MTESRVARRVASGRARVAEAAWSLLQDRPWAEVTVADICERADIAPRTFHRYFPDKVEILFCDAAEHEEDLRAAMARHRWDPAAPRDYLLAVLDDLAGPMAAYGAPGLAARQRLLASDADLLARDLVKRNTLLRIAVDGLTDRLGTSQQVRARMLAAWAMQAFMIGLDEWAARGGDLRAHVRAALSAAPIADL